LLQVVAAHASDMFCKGGIVLHLAAGGFYVAMTGLSMGMDCLGALARK
jgi:hypothetical protein